jgi:hypothetical protein
MKLYYWVEKQLIWLNKWAKNFSRYFSKKDLKVVNRYMKNMLNIINHQGNGNQNHNVIPHTDKDGYYWKVKW